MAPIYIRSFFLHLDRLGVKDTTVHFDPTSPLVYRPS